MRILEIIPDLSKRAGAETFVISLSRTLSINSKNDVWILSLYNNKMNKEFLKDLKGLNIHVVYLNKKRGLDIKNSRTLRLKIKEIKPDVIHSHLNVAISYWLAFGLRKNKWTWVHTIHNLATKEGSRFDRFLKRKYLKKRLVTLVGISDLITTSIEKYYGKNENIKTVYNGIPLKTYSKVEKKEFDLINIARFSEQKNHLFLLKTIKKLTSIYPNFKSILVGDGKLKDECFEYCKQNGMLNNVIFTGEVDDVSQFLIKSKVFVLPSLYEGNPISVLEAMNAGLPIIASKVGGLPDVIQNSYNGYLLEDFNYEEYVETIINLLNNNMLYNQISINNLNDISRFSIEKCSLEYFNIFEECFCGVKNDSFNR